MGDIEPHGDEITIGVPLPPVRFKASRQRKNVLTNLIKEHTKGKSFLLTGEIKVNVEWMIHEQDRHESSRSPDIDNILKPILDAMQGPDGIMVNDSQVQELSCRWIDWPAREQRLDLHLRFLPDEWARKDGLIFVRMSPTLCMPLNRQIPAEGILLMLEVWERQFNTRTELIASGWDYYQANSVMSIQRPFHISRLLGFTVLPLDELRKELIAANQASAVPTQPQKEPLP